MRLLGVEVACDPLHDLSIGPAPRAGTESFELLVQIVCELPGKIWVWRSLRANFGRMTGRACRYALARQSLFLDLEAGLRRRVAFQCRIC